MVKILSIFVAFLENMNFKKGYSTPLDLFGTQNLCNVVKTNIVKSIP